MKKITQTLLVLLCLAVHPVIAQEIPQLTSKDSIVQSSWMLGLGYNIVDDSGDVFNGLFDVNTQWNALAYPSRVSVGRYFKSGIGLEAIGSYNKYKVGKIIDGRVNSDETDYLALDARVSYDLNKIIGETAWFDPYVGVGLGYTDANATPRSTYNAVIGFRTWISDRWGLDFSSSGKWRTGNKGTNHIQHSAGVVYQFGIEKGLSKKGVEETFPFDEVTLVFKVMGKMFALTGLSNWEKGEQKINLKCDPEKSVELREEYEGVYPGFHMSKKHWNTVVINSSDVSDDLVKELINHSYDLVVKGLTKKLQKELEEL